LQAREQTSLYLWGLVKKWLKTSQKNPMEQFALGLKKVQWKVELLEFNLKERTKFLFRFEELMECSILEVVIWTQGRVDYVQEEHNSLLFKLDFYLKI